VKIESSGAKFFYDARGLSGSLMDILVTAIWENRICDLGVVLMVAVPC